MPRKRERNRFRKNLNAYNARGGGAGKRDAAYWNELLRRDGLTMQQGLDPRLAYSADIEKLEIYVNPELNDGRVRPKPQAD